MTFVKVDEVPSVQREHDATASMGEIDDLLVGHRPIRLAGLVGGQDS
jgi:hypothetical protein